jgi:putative redox protein
MLFLGLKENNMKARIKWVEQVSFLGETESGHAVLMDGAPAVGGRNLGPRPMEMLLLGAGGCTSFDVIAILKKSRQAVSDCYVEIEAERAETDPKVFTKIHMHFVVKGRDIKPEAVEKAIKLSAEKYCSASIMLGATAAMTHDFEVVQE